MNQTESSVELQQEEGKETQLEEEYIEEEGYRKSFSLPKNIRNIKILIAIGEFITGALMLFVSIYYFLIQQERTTVNWIFAVLLIIFGVFLVILGPIDIIKPINSALLLKEDVLAFRNNINWNTIPWKEIQEILINEKLSDDPNTNVIIGAEIIRFRTVKDNYFFFADSYPVEEIKDIKESLKKEFNKNLEEEGYIVSERHERPSIKTRLVFYERKVDRSVDVASATKKESEK
ncbi:MAG: hypothetical protein U9O98_10415 [Asgard group archaeon]|nr:hypothetical protein [Asgard group archaeon]